MMEMTDDELMELGPPPEWAVGLARGQLVKGAQLCTRDGRKTGNAVIVGHTMLKVGGMQHLLYVLVTDAGNVIHRNSTEMAADFHPPVWIMGKLLPAQQYAGYELPAR